MGTWKSKVIDIFRVAEPSYKPYNNIMVFRPQDPEELFNLRHAQARNVVERIFGLFKRKFALMEAAPEYTIEMQAMFIPALGGIHNFIRIYDPSDEDLQQSQKEGGNTGHSQTTEREGQDFEDPRVITPEELGLDITAEERRRALKCRDIIAKQMWIDYQSELRRRGLL